MTLESLSCVQNLCPDFMPREIIQRAGKSILIAGTFKSAPAVAKVLTDHGSFWMTRFLHELDFYTAIRTCDRPVMIPDLFHADSQKLVMVEAFLPGEPLGDDRHPTMPIDEAGFRLLLDALPSLHAWRPFPAPSQPSIVQDYESRLMKHMSRGILGDEEVQRSMALLNATSWAPEFNHGDLLLTNCLFDVNEQTIAFLDWEYAGYAVPGYDLALVSMLMLNDARKHRMVDNTAKQRRRDREALFLINQMIVLAREVHLLSEVQHIPILRDCSELVARELASVRRSLSSM